MPMSLLPPAPVVSARGRDRGTTSLLIPSMLSELAFNREVPHPAEKKYTGNTNNSSSNSNSNSNSNNGKAARDYGDNNGDDDDNDDDDDDDKAFNNKSSLCSSWNWNGLLCFSSGDPDLFFDAEEKPMFVEEGIDTNGKIIPITTTSTTRTGTIHTSTTLSTTSESMSSTSTELSKQQQHVMEDDRCSVESVEVKLHQGGSDVVATICECRGGQQEQQPSQQQQQNNRQQAAFDHPSTLPNGENQQKNNQNSHNHNDSNHNPFARIHAPPAPKELPVRFLRAGKGHPIEGQRRYEASLKWRKEHDIDNILLEAHPKFDMIKQNYPHYFHLRGKQGEPVFYEQPPKTDLTALKAGGMDLPGLVRHYTMVTEFQWQFIEKDDFARSITVLDLEGIRMMDFVGECVEYVKMCSQFTGQHYPERAGHVIVVNVPRWFAMIWKVVKPMVDEVTLQKISIVRGQDAVFAALLEKIPVENIPPEYGGKSTMKLGDSPEEVHLRDLITHNNALANGDFRCGGKAANPPCRFCSWGPTRSY